MSNCVSCGKYAAEGNWICPNCHIKANKSYADLEQDLKAAHEEIGRLRARLENKSGGTELYQRDFVKKFENLLYDTIGEFCNNCNNDIALNVDLIREQWKLDLDWQKGRNRELKAENDKLKERLKELREDNL